MAIRVFLSIMHLTLKIATFYYKKEILMYSRWCFLRIGMSLFKVVCKIRILKFGRQMVLPRIKLFCAFWLTDFFDLSIQVYPWFLSILINGRDNFVQPNSFNFLCQSYFFINLLFRYNLSSLKYIFSDKFSKSRGRIFCGF